MNEAIGALNALEPRIDRIGVGDTAVRVLGQAVSTLEYRPVAEIIDDLPQVMEDVQRATSAASEDVKSRYFPSQVVPTWAGERA